MTKLEQIRALREGRSARKNSRGQRAPQQTGALPATETASDKGKAKNGPPVRRRAAKPGALALDHGTTQRTDRAVPGVPREAKLKRKVPKKVIAPAPKRGRPRAEDRGKTLSDTKPWLAAKMSRASWYRRQVKAK